MTAPVIRSARPEDAEALALLGRQTFVETFVEGFAIPYPPVDLAVYLQSAFGVEATTARLADPDEAWWVGETDGKVAAFAECGPCGLPHPDARASHAELKRLYVAGSAQGIGLGRGLLETALDWMQTHTDGPLWIGVWSGNDKAQRLYRRYGFEKAGEYDYPVGNWRDREFILKRD